MPDAEIMTFGVSIKLISFDSSLVMASFSPAKEIGLIPSFTKSMASSPKHSILLS
jgi:hypothetical protein